MQVHSPYILEDLESNMDYEIYVEAVNEHGVGDASPRLIFRTQSQVRLLYSTITINRIYPCLQFFFKYSIISKSSQP